MKLGASLGKELEEGHHYHHQDVWKADSSAGCRVGLH